VKFDGGVALAGDMLGKRLCLHSFILIIIFKAKILENSFYTSFVCLNVRFTIRILFVVRVSRLIKVDDSTVVFASGDYADYQYLKEEMERMSLVICFFFWYILLRHF